MLLLLSTKICCTLYYIAITVSRISDTTVRGTHIVVGVYMTCVMRALYVCWHPVPQNVHCRQSNFMYSMVALGVSEQRVTSTSSNCVLPIFHFIYVRLHILPIFQHFCDWWCFSGAWVPPSLLDAAVQITGSMHARLSGVTDLSWSGNVCLHTERRTNTSKQWCPVLVIKSLPGKAA